ncbi:adenylate/guanylate cyclase domain-containing protein [Alienimonas californiensis]|uniref:Adenylate cyclase 2 n=1 Tax=Alienimonas californiensis TaxID=2527989 RepID=A0A517PCZ8_9PLAN|nr:adenylate/guanylate cyclase domain-containing protein [Alienimonas californiensis]QDT17236.1 Adenylate cyclase 2 [Alienimonas californiensis]
MSGEPGEADGWTIAVDGGRSLTVRPGESRSIGRSALCDLRVPSDPRLSRVHFRVSVGDADTLTIRDGTDGRNPLFCNGERVHGTVHLQDAARLAAGRTRFRVRPPAAAEDEGTVFPGEDGFPGDDAPGSSAVGTLSEGALTFDARTLAGVAVTRPDRRFEAVARLPEVLRTPDDARRLPALCGLLLAGVQDAEAVAVVARVKQGEPGASVPGAHAVQLRSWSGRNELNGPPQVPQELITASLNAGEAILSPSVGGWAFVVPIADAQSEGSGTAPADRGLLVLGSNAAGPAERAADVRFVSLVAEIVSAADRSGRLERQAATLRPFLPPRVLEALGESPDPAALAPAECTASVVFCDLRGFSRTSEELSADLPALLARVSAALSVMTHRIREAGGVTGDFLGDAALAFWGWPTTDPTAPLKAATAAVRIAGDFAARRDPGDPLAGFRVGVGVATGPAVAGRIGTEDQAKITVFGPTANLASRLEGLCGPLRVPVVCDAATADAVLAAQGASAGDVPLRVRPLGTVRPAKMQRAVRVSELLPPHGPAPEGSPLTDRDLARYAEAVAAFTAGDWPRAAEVLQDHPAFDLAQDFLRVRLAEGHRTAPPGWDGVIRVDEK